MKFSFKTRKLKGSVKKINARVKSVPGAEDLTVFGVSNKEGICVTGKEVSADVSNYIHVKGKKFAYNPYRINVGSIGLADPDFEGIVSPAYVVFETGEDINDEFLFLYLRSPLGINLINWYGNRGGVRSALRFKDLEKIDFPDLTFDQQTKALEIVRSQFEKIDDVSVELETQKSLIDKLRQSILQDAIQGKLVPQDPNDEPASELLKRIKTEKAQLIADKKIKKSKPLPPITDEEKPFDLPESWEWVNLDDVCWKITDGFHNTPPKVAKGFPYIAATHVKLNSIDWDGAFMVGEADHRELHNKTNPQRGEILLVNIGAGSGCPAIIDVDFEFSFKNTAILKFNQKLILNKYLFYYLSSIQKQNYENLTRGGNQPFLSLRVIREFAFPLPPIQEQKTIVDKIEELMNFCDELEEQMLRSTQLGERLSQSVLQQAFVQS